MCAWVCVHVLADFMKVLRVDNKTYDNNVVVRVYVCVCVSVYMCVYVYVCARVW